MRGSILGVNLSGPRGARPSVPLGVPVRAFLGEINVGIQTEESKLPSPAWWAPSNLLSI